jgi:hypothetical protein
MSQEDIWTKTETECYEAFLKWRWPETNGQPVCPRCGGTEKVYRYKTRRIFKCGPCSTTTNPAQFSATSGTAFAHRKLSFKKICAALFNFVIHARGEPATTVSIACKINYRSAYLLLHSAREAMEFAQQGRKLFGKVEVDGMQIGMSRRSPNFHPPWGKGYNTAKQCIIVMRQRNGPTLTFIVRREADAVPLLYQHIDPSATVYLDMGIHWQAEIENYRRYFARVEMINHSEFREEPWGVHTNSAESLNDRLRRLSRTYTRISGDYADLYAAEGAWRRDHRTDPNGVQFETLMKEMCALPVSRRFGNYRRVPKAKPAAPYTSRKGRTY